MTISILSLISLGFLVLTFVPVPYQLLERFSPAEILEGGGASRFLMCRIGYEAFLHQRLTGYGYNNCTYAYELFRSSVTGSYLRHPAAHNICLQTFVELGVIGGLLVLFIVWKHWRRVRNLGHGNSIAIPLEAAFIGVLANSATLGTLYYKYFWFTFTLVLILAKVERPKWLHE